MGWHRREHTFINCKYYYRWVILTHTKRSGFFSFLFPHPNTNCSYFFNFIFRGGVLTLCVGCVCSGCFSINREHKRKESSNKENCKKTRENNISTTTHLSAVLFRHFCKNQCDVRKATGNEKKGVLLQHNYVFFKILLYTP